VSQPSDVTRNDDRNRYELTVEGQVAFSEYNRLANAIMFTHTEVPESLEGQGIGSALAKGALDDVRAQGLQVIPLCPFIAAYIRRHQEYVDIVSPVSRKQVSREG
jgi:predicted GNAT family acetyltransferase